MIDETLISNGWILTRISLSGIKRIPEGFKNISAVRSASGCYVHSCALLSTKILDGITSLSDVERVRVWRLAVTRSKSSEPGRVRERKKEQKNETREWNPLARLMVTPGDAFVDEAWENLGDTMIAWPPGRCKLSKCYGSVNKSINTCIYLRTCVRVRE